MSSKPLVSKEDGTPKITPELIQNLESKVEEYHAQFKDYFVSPRLDSSIKSLNKLRLVRISETLGDGVIFDEVVDFNSVSAAERKQLLELGKDIYDFAQLYQNPCTERLHNIEKLLALYYNNIPFDINRYSLDILIFLNSPVPKVPTKEEASRKVEEFKTRLSAIKDNRKIKPYPRESIHLACICLIVSILITCFIFSLIFL